MDNPMTYRAVFPISSRTGGYAIPPKMVLCPTTKAAMKAVTRTAASAMPVAADPAVPIAVHRVKLFCLRSQFCILALLLFASRSRLVVAILSALGLCPFCREGGSGVWRAGPCCPKVARCVSSYPGALVGFIPVPFAFSSSNCYTPSNPLGET